MAKPRKKRQQTCDKLAPRGVCLAIVEDLAAVVYCPAGRAENCSPGVCCHHPFFGIKTKLRVMNEAGVKLCRYGSKLRDPDFVDRLYRAFLNLSESRRATSSRTSRRS